MMPHDLSNLFNTTAIGLVVVYSWLVSIRHNSRFFRHWTVAYVFGFLVMVLDLAAPMLGRPAWWTGIQVGLFFSGAWHFLQTARHLRNATLPRRLFLPVLAVAFLATVLAQASGVSPVVPLAIAALINSAALLAVAHALLSGKTLYPRAGILVLAIPLIMLALWPLSYPLMVDTPWAWLGFGISGILHLSVGIGMVVFLLEEAAAVVARQNEDLRQLDKLKTNFLGMISHELRTPLTVIKAASSLVDDGAVEGEASRRLVKNVRQQADQLHRLIDDLLDLSRLELGKLAYAKAETDLAELVARGTSNFRSVLAGKHLELTLMTSDKPLWAMVDEGRIAQVLDNLLNNAMKFTPEGGTITVRLFRSGEAARLEVKDTGIGMKPDTVARIFDRFYQVESGDGRRTGGMGLGLAICKSIIEEGHNGQLWAESEPGKGSTFVVMLPLLGRKNGVHAGHSASGGSGL